MTAARVTRALLLTAAAAAAGPPDASVFRFTVLHANDMHARYEETCTDRTCFGGFARMRAAVDAERARAAAAGAPAVFLHAGDLFFGTPFYDALGWEPAADLFGDLGADAMCLGNHEFHNGPAGLAPFLSSKNISSIPIVVTNINTTGEPSLTNIRPSTVLTVNNRTIGIVGYLTPDVHMLNDPGRVIVSGEVDSVQAEVSKLKKSGVDFIIALGHSGLETDKKIAREVAGVDAVVGGHSHSYLRTGPPQDMEIPAGPYPVIEKLSGNFFVPVVQAYAFTKYLGKLVLTFNSENVLISAEGGPIFLNSTDQDAKIMDKVKYYRKLLDQKEVRIAIGKTYVFLDGKCSCRETNLGDLITDSFIRANMNILLKSNKTYTGWTDAAIAITVSSSIQSSIDASKARGIIYDTDVRRALPYQTGLWKITVNGSTIMKALEYSSSLFDYVNCAIPENSVFGGFLQMSGMHVEYNAKAHVGWRVKTVYIRCSECMVPSYEPLEREKSYRIIMPKYLIDGGDKFIMFKAGTNKENLKITETEALQEYIKKESPIWAEHENRITILN
ncbi:Calcineurin-like phosphoesterase domain, ApaH type,5'-Nucleotidase, C-terminal,5'- [Cinara cedri]|uniref:5'-nucleotidase n=1 Tax=Cinara cedri TaxID=506608 RepID=A0A5E4NCH5_9HEMI|nr:Calcineurin-like phosphoesterase domain, ApaH type,5'-Nucleotidase, C-terminal,5'- [Cinara cedri]